MTICQCHWLFNRPIGNHGIWASKAHPFVLGALWLLAMAEAFNGGTPSAYPALDRYHFNSCLRNVYAV